MKRKIFTTIMTALMLLSLVGCGGNQASQPVEMADTETTDFPEQLPVDERLGKRLGELMDLSAYMEDVELFDYFGVNNQELKDLVPFEVYEISDGQLINSYADGSGEKTVKSGSIMGMYGTPMVIKMDGSDTFDIVVRATSDRYSSSYNAMLSDLPDFKMIQVDLTKEAVESLYNEHGEFKEEYRHLLHGSAAIPNIGMTVKEYADSKGKECKYFVINPEYSYIEEFSEYNIPQISEQKFVIAYFGEQPIPLHGDEIAIVPIYIDEYNSYKSYDEMLELFNSYYVAEVTALPDEAGMATLVSKYSGESANTGAAEVGLALEEYVDLSAYNAIVEELEASSDYERELKDILPFEIYAADEYKGVYNVSEEVGGPGSVLSGHIPGDLFSVMVIKLKGASTYDILLRMPYERNDMYNSSSFKDLGNFRVLVTGVLEDELSRMVTNTGCLSSDYTDLIYDITMDSEGRKLVKYFILEQMQEPKYIVFNPNTASYEELTEANKSLIQETSTVYLYFGGYSNPPAGEIATAVDVYWGSEIETMTLEEVINKIDECTVRSTEPLLENPFATVSY